MDIPTATVPAPLTREGFLQLWTPRKPLAADVFEPGKGLNRHAREVALQMKYIEIAPRFATNLIVVDIDKMLAYADVQAMVSEGRLPAPSFSIINTESTHAHVGWFTSGTVRRNATREVMSTSQQIREADSRARARKGQDYYRAIREGLRDATGGDKGFTNTSMRNPMLDWKHGFEEHAVAWGTDHLYTFDEIAATLDLAKRAPREMPLLPPMIELTGGRNTDTFNALRVYGYRAWLNATSDADFRAALSERAREINMSWGSTVKGSLGPAELNAIERSVARWIGSNFTRDAFSKIQVSRSARRWLTTPDARDKQRARIEVISKRVESEQNPELAQRLSEKREKMATNLHLAEMRAAMDEEIAEYLAAGMKPREIHASVCEPRGLTYEATRSRIRQVRAAQRAAQV